VDDSGNIVRTS